jgi:transcriptional regulator with GAF, ATPase, and Fis domain
VAVEQRDRAVATYEQHLVDAEVTSTRRRLLRIARRGGAADWFLDPEFLAVADRATVCRAVIVAALRLGRVAAVDLQRFDADANVLLMEASEGFSEDFTRHFASLALAESTACLAAWTSRRPVLVRDVTQSEIFPDVSTVDVLVTAGTRAVISYPLVAQHRAWGVLSFHARRAPDLPPETATLARRAATALAVVGGPRHLSRTAPDNGLAASHVP